MNCCWLLCLLFSLVFLSLLASIDAALAAGFANGVKIGEASDTSVVLWTRLTSESEASNRVDQWDESNPHWRAPGEEGEIRFVWWKDGEEAGKRRSTEWKRVTAVTDYCHQSRIPGLTPTIRAAKSKWRRSASAGIGRCPPRRWAKP